MVSPTCNAPVAPGPLPVIGHAWPLMRRPLRFARQLSEQGELVEVRLGGVRALVPCQPELLWRVLTDDRVFDKGGPFFDRVRATIGNGVGSCAFAEHRRQRRLIQPSFHPARLAGYAVVMEEEAAALVEGWREGRVVDAYQELFGAALRTVLRTLFAARDADAVVDRFRGPVETVLHQLTFRMFVPPSLQRLPLPVNRRFDRAVGELRRGIADLVAELRRGGTDRGDLVSALIAARDDENGAKGGLEDDEIHDQVLTLVVAGADSVAAAVSWALYLLHDHPHVREQLEDEADSALADRRAGVGDVGDMPDLPCTVRVITEALRLYPPGWLFTRVTTDDTELAGRRLPAGTTVAFCAPAVHRNPSVHRNPDVFDPDRWLPERARGLPRGAFAAFGGGARKCAGEAYGLTESTMLLSTIIARRRLRLVPGSDVRPVALSTALRPRRLLMEVTTRRGRAT
ncbi:cytochrome P450 [Streptomyces sp. NPDC015242]|uniref:cytochrome P450 n=1 Tax=Streptomyces sp. NPDC015242 TaxID=3364951 RepID=UPI0037021BF6